MMIPPTEGHKHQSTIIVIQAGIQSFNWTLDCGTRELSVNDEDCVQRTRGKISNNDENDACLMM